MLHRSERAVWAREATWRRFMDEVPCTYSMCVNLDITRLYAAVKAGGHRLFPTVLYGLSRAVNRRAEFRMGLTPGGEPGVYDEVHPCYTVFHPENETFTSVWQAYDPDFAAFFAAYAAREERPAAPLPENIFYVSCLPWVSFTGFNLNLPAGFRDLAPLFTVGRFYLQDGRRLLPPAMQLHHAACDGYHAAMFLKDLQDWMDDFAG